MEEKKKCAKWNEKLFCTVFNIEDELIPMNMEIFTGKILRPHWRTSESTRLKEKNAKDPCI